MTRDKTSAQGSKKCIGFKTACEPSEVNVALNGVVCFLENAKNDISDLEITTHGQPLSPRMDSLECPYWSSIETIALNCLVFEKARFCVCVSRDRRTDERTHRQTEGHRRRIKPSCGEGLIISARRTKTKKTQQSVRRQWFTSREPSVTDVYENVMKYQLSGVKYDSYV